jgi:ankyrin repeat protein/tetratricopeptide (TPR) repeat protein
VKRKRRNTILAIIFGLVLGIALSHLGLSPYIERLVDSFCGTSDSGQTPLHMAANRGSVKDIKQLLNAEVDPNARDPWGRTPLHMAAAAGHADAAKLLIEHGADVEVRTSENYSPLVYAALNDHVGVIEELIASGAEVDGHISEFAKTALFGAVQQGNTDAVNVLIRHGANVNHKSDGFPNTALHMAAIRGRVDPAKILLANGANVNEQDLDSGITALYIATVTDDEEMAAVLTAHGADESIPDKYGQTAHQAKGNMQARLERQLLPTSKGAVAFDRLAIVQLVYLGKKQRGFLYRGTRVGFVIGDGSLIVTAAHCVDDIIEDNERGILVKPQVISRYYGDIFNAQIVAVDGEADVAILRAAWDRHPYLQLATMDELSGAKEIAIVAYPPPKTDGAKQKLYREVFMERLPLIKVNESDGREAVVLAPGRFIGRGWSGSPMILPDSGKVAGVFGRAHQKKHDEQTLFDYLMGWSVDSIQSLLRKNNIDLGKSDGRTLPDRRADAEEAFSRLIEHSRAVTNNDYSLALTEVKTLVRLRPQSVNAHLLLPPLLAEVYGDSPEKRKRLQESVYKKVLEFAPDSATALAGHGNFLWRHQRSDEAIVQLDRALELEPDNAFVMANLLDVLKDRDPNRAELYARRLVEKDPESADYWFELSGVLWKTGKHEEELEAAEKAVSLDEVVPYPHRRRLADALMHVEKLTESESNYRLLLKEHECARCWFAYAKLLAKLGPARYDDASRAIEETESMDQDELVSPESTNELREKLTKPKTQLESKNDKP